MKRSLLIATLAAATLAPLPARANPAFDAAVLAEINRLRTQPASYVRDLMALRATFNELGHYQSLSDGRMWASHEGVAAVDEAIATLSRLQPRAPLATSPLLAAAAADHSAEQGPRGGFGHISETGRLPSDRLRRHGGGSHVAEAITYGATDPRDVVLQLIVDDGVPGRGHRATLLNPEYAHAGAACGAHSRLGYMCTVTLSATASGK